MPASSDNNSNSFFLTQKDIDAISAKINLMAQTSYQLTYSSSLKKIPTESPAPKNIILRQTVETYPQPGGIHAPLVNELVKLTVNDFQNNQRAIVEFLELIDTLQRMSRDAHLKPFFQHEKVDTIIDKQAEYATFQEIIDELDHHYPELMSALSSEIKAPHEKIIAHHLNKLKIYLLFIESLTNLVSQEFDTSKSVTQIHFLSFVIRPDRAQPRFYDLFKKYFDALRNKVGSFQ